MKLIYAIVSSDDSSSVSGALTQNGFFATKLASTGGFLMSGNTTFLICTDDENVDLHGGVRPGLVQPLPGGSDRGRRHHHRDGRPAV